MSKVYYIGADLQGCYYVRCMMPLIHNGWNGDKISLRSKQFSAKDKTRYAMDSDIIVFHRPDTVEKLELALLLKYNGKKIVFDNDDTYLGIDAMKFGNILKQKKFYINEFIKDIADLVTCSTETLAEEYRKLTDKPVVVLPNMVDPDDWDKPLRNETDKVRIGIIGSSALNNDFDKFHSILKTLDEMPNVQIVLFSLPPMDTENNPKRTEVYKKEYDFWTSLKNIEWQNFVPMEDYFETLNEMKLDIVLIPRDDNYFNRCKSNLKFLECSMLEIPVIAQGFKTGDSPYQGKDEDYMSICIEEEEWLPVILDLINNKSKRLKQGKRAKKYVLKNYDIKDNYKKWQEAYKLII